MDNKIKCMIIQNNYFNNNLVLDVIFSIAQIMGRNLKWLDHITFMA